MSRSITQLLGQQAFGEQLTQYVADPTIGGQGGYANDLTTWLNNQAYVSKQVIAIVLEAPGFFNLMSNPTKWVEILRAMFETHVRTIEGLNSGIEYEFEEHPVGGAGEVQEEVVNARRARSNPVIGLVDKVGLPFQNFLRCWGQYGMMDPDTKYALASNLDTTPSAPWTADMYTATVLFFEPDAAHKRVTKAWLSTNMMPHSNGEESGRRDLTAGGELLNLSIEFTALTQTGTGVRALAQSMLDALNRTNANPLLRAAFLEGQDSDVAAAQDSYANTVASVADSAITTPQNP